MVHCTINKLPNAVPNALYNDAISNKHAHYIYTGWPKTTSSFSFYYSFYKG